MFSKFNKIFSVKFVIIVMLIDVSFIIAVAMFFMFNAPKISEEAYGEFYKVGNVEVPNITSIINRRPKVTGVIIGDSEANPYKSFTYSGISTVESDIESYIQYLIKSGFKLESEENANSVLWTATLSKYLSNNDKLIVVKIKGDVSEYTISIEC